VEAAKGSCLTSSQAIAASVTNPFMVTAAFTIFFELELFFIRILAISRRLRRFAGRMAGPHPVKPTLVKKLDFLCSAQYITCIAQRGPGKGRVHRSRTTGKGLRE
jgi:hypothetical protein